MNRLYTTLFFICLSFSIDGQSKFFNYYSESENNGILIQNSFPKGGRYPGKTTEHYNYSYLVFYTRITNESKKPIALNLHFLADSIPIPNSPNTYVKIFLPKDSMTQDKINSFSYGINELESFAEPTQRIKTLNPDDSFLFNVVAVFYQTKEDAWKQERGGNRAEFILKGKDVFFCMSPQIEMLHCGTIEVKD